MTTGMEIQPRAYRGGFQGINLLTPKPNIGKDNLISVPSNTAVSAARNLSNCQTNGLGTFGITTTHRLNSNWSLQAPKNLALNQLQKSIERNQALDTLFPRGASVFSFGRKNTEGTPNKYIQATTNNMFVQNQKKSTFGRLEEMMYKDFHRA